MTDMADVGRNEFAFLHGSWFVQHSHLRWRLVGDHTWISSGGNVTVHPILAGAGNIDEHVTEHRDGSYEAVTVRTFDPVSQRWSIVWIDGRRMSLDLPVAGSFRDDDGFFEGDESSDGRPVRVRLRWSRTSSYMPRWKQTFSDEDGVNWETNWVVDFRRCGSGRA